MNAKQQFLSTIETSARDLMGAGFSPKEAVEKVVEFLGEFAPLPPNEADLIRFYLNFQVDEKFAALVRNSVWADVQRMFSASSASSEIKGQVVAKQPAPSRIEDFGPCLTS